MPYENYQPRPARIEALRDETPTERTFTLNFGGGEEFRFGPGQFVEVSVFGQGEAPFCITSSPARTDAIQITVRRYPGGLVSSALHSLATGDYVGVRGPLGNGFPVEQFVGRDLLFVAGGIGLPAIRASILYVLEHRSSYRNVTLLYGARTAADRVYTDDLAAWAASPDIVCQQTVDMKNEGDDWDGPVGLITTLFPPLELDAPNTTAIIVGPAVMYPFVVAECRQKGIRDEDLYFSLEAQMKCGVGKCGHCTMKHKYICLDGPVFTYTQMREMQE